MTQEQLSESSGISVRTIRRLEAGENVEDATILSILTAFGTTLQDLEDMPLDKDPTDKNENETKENEPLQFLQRVEGGRDLVRIIANVHQYGFDYNDCETKDQVEEVQAFLTTVGDVIDIWTMVEIGRQFDLENILDEQIKNLARLNFWVFALRQFDEESKWATAIVQVYSKNNPMIMKIKSDKTLMRT